MKAKITKSSVDKAESNGKRWILWDTDLSGFGVKVQPSGAKTYFVYYRTDSGQQRRPTIGKHGEITADQARKKAREWLASAQLGHDVSAERKTARSAPTVKELTERYLREYAEIFKKPSSIKSDRALIRNHILPLIGTMKVKDVKKSDIESVKVAVREGRTSRRLAAKKRGRRIILGGKGAANRTVALLSKMFSCAETWGLREGNPALRIQKYPERRKDRFLDMDEIKRLLNALNEAERQNWESPYAIAAIRLLLFTGLRRGELSALKWKHVDVDKSQLTLEDSKTGNVLFL